MPDVSGAGARAVAARVRPHVRLIAVMIAVILSGILLTLFITTRKTDLAEGTREPASTQPGTAVPTATLPAAATPSDVGPAYPPGSLASLLRLAPDTLDDDRTGLPIEATYADLDRWLAGQGIDRDQVADNEMARQLEPLGLPEVLQARGLTAEWRNVYGFDLRQVDQVLAVGHAPNQILIMPGRYDADTLYETWVESGYQAVEVEETTVWSLAPGDRIDLSAPASRPALGMLNTIVLLDDGTLVATARQSRMEAALRAVHGRDDSLLDNDLLRRAAVQPAVAGSPCVVIASGHLLQIPVRSEAGTAFDGSSGGAGTPIAPAPEPAVDLVVFSLRPSDSGEPADIAMTMLYDDPPDTAAGLRELLEARVATSEWSHRYRLVSIQEIGGQGAMIDIVFSPIGGRRAILDLIEHRDLDPFTWTESE